ncbi:MAG: hypothetical protein IPJ65_24590 [Archangiaceae bacterium]|nr:hypothetical protein [Archangiaceae bacterium]
MGSSWLAGVALLLLAARPDLHGAAELGAVGAAPFETAGLSPEVTVRAYVELNLSSRFAVGVIAPVSVGFYSASHAAVPTSFEVIDLTPGPRVRLNLTGWLAAALELGIGPTIFQMRTFVPLYGTQDDTRAYFAARAALELEVAPPQLEGFMFWVEPAALHARFASAAFSEYACGVGIGYRR